MDLLGILQEEHGYLRASGAFDRSVGETSELQRIRDAPRRVWQDDPDLPRLVSLLTRYLKHTDVPSTPCPTRCKGCEAKELLPRQAAMLRDLFDGGDGVVGGLRPGAGKTLVSLVAPTLIKATKPVLVVPASLVEKTLLEKAQYARHWKVANVKVISYEWLSNPKQLKWLEEYAPDLVMADESQKLKNSGCKAWKRLFRYYKINPSFRFVPMSGSIAGRSASESWHYLRLALRSRAPVPKSPMEMRAWCYALDEKVPPEARFEPGALLTLSQTDASLPPLERARNAYRDRFTTTKGIIFTADDVPPVGLALKTTEIAIPEEAEEMIRVLRADWVLPNGKTYDTPLQVWAQAQYMGCGLWYKWDPYPPDQWVFARRDWHKFVREKLKFAVKLDSKVHLVEGIKAGDIDDGGVYERWRAVKPTFIENSVPVWIHDVTLGHCAAWLANNPKSLCWVAVRAFGERLSQLTGIPYFSREGLDQKGRLIDSYTGGPAIVSIKACMEGHNLQQFSTNLFSWVPSKGSWIEQALARTHREGQEEDEVQGDFLLTCQESFKSLAQSIRDSRFVVQSHGQSQRLCYAQSDFGAVMDLVDTEQQHWSKNG